MLKKNNKTFSGKQPKKKASFFYRLQKTRIIMYFNVSLTVWLKLNCNTHLWYTYWAPTSVKKLCGFWWLWIYMEGYLEILVLWCYVCQVQGLLLHRGITPWFLSLLFFMTVLCSLLGRWEKGLQSQTKFFTQLAIFFVLCGSRGKWSSRQWK